jgi:SAM-dependent MidA family methyltransferase
VAHADVPFRWTSEVPPVTGLLLANEWLDSVPLDVVEDGRLVLVAPDGTEEHGAPLASEWADTWWPGGGRVEVGASRDLAWAAAVARVERGLAVAVDYGHTTATRRPTLTGYRAGRQVVPVPDGSCDLTAHVALDAVAAATGSVVMRQCDALAALGVTARLPDASSPSYARDLARASQARELLDPDGLGGFGWVVKAIGCEVGWMGR